MNYLGKFYKVLKLFYQIIIYVENNASPLELPITLMKVTSVRFFIPDFNLSCELDFFTCTLF